MMHKILLSVALILGAAFLAACSVDIPQFKKGDIVVMKLDGRKAMIVSTYCPQECRYKVRLAPTGEVYTDTHIFGADGPLSTKPYTLITVYEYELAPGAIK